MATFKVLFQSKSDSVREGGFLVLNTISSLDFYTALLIDESSTVLEVIRENGEQNFINCYNEMKEKFFAFEISGELNLDKETKALFNKLMNR